MQGSEERIEQFLDFDEMIESSEGIVLELFGGRKYGYSIDWVGEFISIRGCWDGYSFVQGDISVTKNW